MSPARPRRWPWIAASVALVLAAPALLHALLYAQHAAAFHGICGPHAPDIPAHACTRAEYLDEFGAGFAGLGLLLLEGVATVGMGAVVLLGWGARSLWARRRLAARPAGT